MLRTRNGPAGQGRQGMILLVVLALLTLFALVGLTFVLTADAQATASRLAREAETQRGPDVDPEAAFAFVLGQLIYDASDTDKIGIYSALRGHSLARNMYGWYEGALNDKPYSGTGRLHNPSPPILANAQDPRGREDAFLMNFMHFAADGFLRDPEHYGTRANPAAAINPQTQPYVGGFNVPYTYPDHQNFYLAQIDPATGKIVAPSFHRDYLFGSLADTRQSNWSSPEGKYLTLRPRPADNDPAFPYPVDAGGDVKNLDGAPGGCDSIWIDVGAPVMTAPDGRKYKMLVAPLILDLDGRINLNVVGNILGTNGAHRSNHGLGPWEVNPGAVLNADATEWQKLFNGTDPTNAARVRGRYDATGTPPRRPVGTTPPVEQARWWARMDFNGMQDNTTGATAGAASMRIQLPVPTAGSASGYYPFPTFPATSYGDWSGFERTRHPLMYHPLSPAAPNRLLPLAGMAPLLRWGGSGSDMLTSDLLRLLPNNLAPPSTAAPAQLQQAILRRNLVTLLSFDLDRPGATPYVWAPNDNLPTRYQIRGTNTTPINNLPIPYKNIPMGIRPFSGPGTEYESGTWRSALAGYPRLNLNRRLSPYPAPDGNGRLDPNNVDVRNATQDRQTFASDIFTVLRRATGAPDPATVGATSPEFKALRYLAQLAANIVDYIDTDDYSTAFNWFRQEYVFGVELPRLVINETYAELTNSTAPGDLIRPAAGGPQLVPPTGHYDINLWVELHNPMPENDPVSRNTTKDCIARLTTGTAATNAVYQVVLAKNNTNVAALLQDPTNVLGDPDFRVAPGTNTYPPVTTYGSALNAATQRFVLPMPANNLASNNRFNVAAGGNTGFYLLGPNTTFVPGINPAPNLPAATLASAQMTYKIPAVPPAGARRPPGARPAPGGFTPHPTVLLRRLANPTFPYNPSTANPLTYNPYITVDYVEQADGDVNDARLFDSTGTHTPTPPANRASWGRSQPYAATNTLAASQWRRQQPQPALANRPQQTFYRQNSTATTRAALNAATTDATLNLPFDWLVHLDRALISPVELLHVSGCKPHELTQRFVQGTGNNAPANKHLAPWGDQTTRLYRFFEFVEAPANRLQPLVAADNDKPWKWTWHNGVASGGRIPGKININTVWNLEVFKALCDAQAGNSFNDTAGTGDVTRIFQAMLRQRSGGTTGSTPVLRPTDSKLAMLNVTTPDRPFWPLSLGPADANPADPLSADARGIENTLLRTTGGFDVPDPPTGPRKHPYQKKELLTKIFNNVTTRSNVFAVWMTVGFFEVKDDTARPVKLGAEMGKSENRHVRHRMFAIVDRSRLQVFSTTLTTLTGVAATAGQNTYLQLNAPKPNPPTAPPNYTYTAFTDGRTGHEWRVTPGTLLVIQPNTNNEETVRVQQNARGLYFVSTRDHVIGSAVIVRGNPGPITRYDPRSDTAVVPYFAIID